MEIRIGDQGHSGTMCDPFGQSSGIIVVFQVHRYRVRAIARSLHGFDTWRTLATIDCCQSGVSKFDQTTDPLKEARTFEHSNVTG
jgi:hypothetical protein